MGWNSKGKFGFNSGKTLRRYPTRKASHANFRSIASSRRHEFALVKEVNYGNKVQDFDLKSAKFGLEDGGLSAEKESLVYSLNKHKRWLLPDILKGEVGQLFHKDGVEIAVDSERKSSRRKLKKGKGLKPEPIVRVSVVERHLGVEARKNKPDCFGVTSSVPQNKHSKPERKPRKKHAHVGDLKSEISDQDVEVCYEFSSPFPKATWPSNQHFRYYQKHNEMDELVLQKSKKKRKGNRNKWKGRAWQLDEGLEEVDGWALTDECEFDEDFQENGPEPLNSDFLFPIGGYIRESIEAINKKNTEEFTENEDDASTRSIPHVYSKRQVVYIENDFEMLSNTSNNEENLMNGMIESEPLKQDTKFAVTLIPEDITFDNLSHEFGSNYIEGDVSPRKLIISANTSGTGIDNFALLFEILDSLSNESTIEATVAFTLPKTELTLQNAVNEILHSELNRLQNDGPLKVKTIVDLLMGLISSETTTLPKNFLPKKSAMKIPVEFIQQVCKQESEVCDLKEATGYALASEKRPDVACLVAVLENENASKETERRRCEICYAEEDVVRECTDRTSFTQLLHCSHHFCNDCWSSYIASRIHAVHSHITCPHFDCATTISEPLVWSSTNSERYQKYRAIKVENLISTNPRLRPCPALDCPYLALVRSLDERKSSSAVPVLCNCGLLWCFSCQNEAHWPASCEEMEAFRRECKNLVEYKRALRLPSLISSVHVKRCPRCRQPMEKGVGCQHMSCRCGHQFCWKCLCSWEGHDSFSCFKRKKEFEEIDLTVSVGSARCDRYCKMSLKHCLERVGKNFFVFKQLKDRAKKVESAHEFVMNNPNTSTCRFVRKYVEKNVSFVLEDVFHFKNLAHFVLENTATCVAVSKTTKLSKSLDRQMQFLEFIVQRCAEVISQPVLLFDEWKLKSLEAFLKRGQKLIRNINGLVAANRKA